jgi:hypothetical protein
MSSLAPTLEHLVAMFQTTRPGSRTTLESGWSTFRFARYRFSPARCSSCLDLISKDYVESSRVSMILSLTDMNSEKATSHDVIDQLQLPHGESAAFDDAEFRWNHILIPGAAG